MRTKYDQYYLWIAVVLIDIGLAEVGPAAFAVFLVLMREVWRGSPHLYPGAFGQTMNRFWEKKLLVAAVSLRDIADRTGMSASNVRLAIAVLEKRRWIRRINGPGRIAYVLGSVRDKGLCRVHAEFRATLRSFRKTPLRGVPQEAKIKRLLLSHLRIGFHFIDYLMAKVKPRLLAIYLVLYRSIWRQSLPYAKSRKCRDLGRLYDRGMLVARISQEELGAVAGSCRETVGDYIKEMERLGWLRTIVGLFEMTFVLGERVPAEPGSDRRWSTEERVYAVGWAEEHIRLIDDLREVVESVDHPRTKAADAAPSRAGGAGAPAAEPKEARAKDERKSARMDRAATPSDANAGEPASHGSSGTAGDVARRSTEESPRAMPATTPSRTPVPSTPPSLSGHEDGDTPEAAPPPPPDPPHIAEHFRTGFARRWPHAPVPELTPNVLVGIQEAIDGLASEGIPADAAFDAIDFIFDRWHSELPKRLSWEEEMPGFGLITKSHTLGWALSELLGLPTVGKTKVLPALAEIPFLLARRRRAASRS